MKNQVVFNKTKKTDNIPWSILQAYAYKVASNLLKEDVTSDETDITCPGEAEHGNGTAEGHCLLYLDDGAPSIYCVHESCAAVVADCNFELRKRIGYMRSALSVYDKQGACAQYDRLEAAAYGGVYIPGQTRGQTVSHTKRKKIKETLDISKRMKTLEKAPGDWKLPKANIENPSILPAELQTLFHLKLFQNCEGKVWTGERWTSGEKYKEHYKDYKEAIKKTHAPFIGMSTFKKFTRSNKESIDSPYIVMECDEFKKAFDKDYKLTDKDKTLCVYKSIELMKDICYTYDLEPVIQVDSGNGSLHTWFLRKEVEAVFNTDSVKELKILGLIFEALKMDKAMVKLSQPARLAGKMRGTRLQKLMYFNELKIYQK